MASSSGREFNSTSVASEASGVMCPSRKYADGSRCVDFCDLLGYPSGGIRGAFVSMKSSLQMMSSF